MPLYKINAPMPGSYVEGLGVLRSGDVVNVPTSIVVRRNGRDKRVPIPPRLMWIPQDADAWKAFHDYFGNVKIKQRDAQGNVIKDQLGKDVEVDFKDANGKTVQVQPLPDLTPEPEMTPEEEEAAIESRKRAEELQAARAEAVEQYKAVLAGQNQFPREPLPVPTPAADPLLEEEQKKEQRAKEQKPTVIARAAASVNPAGAPRARPAGPPPTPAGTQPAPQQPAPQSEPVRESDKT